MADERPQAIPIPAKVAGERGGVQHVAAIAVRGGREPVSEPARQAIVDLVALDEVHVKRLVAVLGEQQRTRGVPVAARAPGLLVVGLERRRHARVQDRAHVRLVHPHPEGVGGADRRARVAQEAPLDSARCSAMEPRVVGHRLLAEGDAQSAASSSAPARVPA